jgi:hypothetical protein
MIIFLLNYYLLIEMVDNVDHTMDKVGFLDLVVIFL